MKIFKLSNVLTLYIVCMVFQTSALANGRHQQAVQQNQNINIIDPNILKANEARGDQRDILENVQEREEQLTIMKLNCIAPAVKNVVAMKCDCPSVNQTYNINTGCVCSISGVPGSVNSTCTGCSTNFTLVGSTCNCGLTGNVNQSTCTCLAGPAVAGVCPEAPPTCLLSGNINTSVNPCVCNAGPAVNNVCPEAPPTCLLSGNINTSVTPCVCNDGPAVNNVCPEAPPTCLLSGNINTSVTPCVCNAGPAVAGVCPEPTTTCLLTGENAYAVDTANCECAGNYEIDPDNLNYCYCKSGLIRTNGACQILRISDEDECVNRGAGWSWDSINARCICEFAGGC